MEAALIWFFDLLLWICMRFVWVTPTFRTVVQNGGDPPRREQLVLPEGDPDFSTAIAQAKEFLEDQGQAAIVILDKFKILIGMYTFSIPVLIGFFSPKLILFQKWELLIFGVLVCIPGYCIYRFLSVKRYKSFVIDQSDINQTVAKQQINQINWFYSKGYFINCCNNFSVNIFLAAYRWFAILIIILLGMILFSKRMPVQMAQDRVNNYFANGPETNCSKEPRTSPNASEEKSRTK